MDENTTKSEQISENVRKSEEKNKILILIRVAIVLCVVLVSVLAGGIYASKNIRTAEPRIAQSGITKVAKVDIESETDQVSIVQPVDLLKTLRVSKVVDGDTIVVESMSRDLQQKTTIRLIGMNTPETVDPRRKVECFGKEASAKAKEMLLGKTVRLEYDDTQDGVDKYGRRLAYVFVQDESYATKQVSNPDTEIFFNKYMIEEGYAYEYTYSKPYKYQKEFKDAQKRAEVEVRGLWSSATCNGKKNV